MGENKISEPNSETDVLAKVSSTILQEGIDITISIAHPNLLHRWKLIKQDYSYRITPICLGTLLKISNLLIKLDSQSLKSLKGIDEEVLGIGLQNIAFT